MATKPPNIDCRRKFGFAFSPALWILAKHADQLLAGLLAYAGSAHFNPESEIPLEQLKELLPS